MWRLIVGVMLACVALSVNASDESLMIGGTRLTLGMEKSRTWELLKRYNIQCLDQEKKPPVCNSWGVSESRGDMYEFLGSVYFSNGGRIKTVMKNYNQKQWGDSPEKFTSFLYEVLRQYGNNGETFIASIGEVREPGWNTKNIFFRSGRKVISVGYGEGGRDENGSTRKPFVGMYEKLE